MSGNVGRNTGILAVAVIALSGFGLWISDPEPERPLYEDASGLLSAMCKMEHPRFDEFFFDELRRAEPVIWESVIAQCDQCQEVDACLPVVAVAGWYREPGTSPIQARPAVPLADIEGGL